MNFLNFFIAFLSTFPQQCIKGKQKQKNSMAVNKIIIKENLSKAENIKKK
jgi:hypothetical protein